MPRVQCGGQIRVGPAPGSENYAGQIATAAAAWNDALDSRASGVPHFIAGTGYDLQVAVVGGGSVYCGEGSYPQGSVWVITLHNTGCAGKNTADITTALTHELSHALGMKDDAEELGKPGVSDGCTTNLNLDLSINSFVCQHDVEMLYAAYGMRPGLPPLDWEKPIVTGLELAPSAMTLHVQQTQSEAIICAQFDRPGGRSGGGGGQLAPPLTDCSLSGLGFAWSSDNPQVAGVLAPTGNPVTIQANAAGSTNVRVTISSGLPPDVQLGGIFATIGSAAAVTVPSAPPGPFKATAVTGLTPPITTGGAYSLWADVSNPPVGTLTVAFNISSSNGAIGPIFTGYNSSPYSIVIPNGSYSIHIEAIPAVGGQSGIGFAADVPVCTGGGGGGGQLARHAGPSPNKVGGC